MMGTGWLVSPDTFITAGHVVYDHGKRLGPTLELRCYIGYNGQASVGRSGVQERFGQYVVTTAEWLESSNNRPEDVAFVKVDRAFTGRLNTFTFEDTPLSVTGSIGVTGYPADKVYEGEGGGQMWQQFSDTDHKYHLEDNPRHMIFYSISTFGGMSSSLNATAYASYFQRADEIHRTVRRPCAPQIR
jgi:V8-like Glu-specific endopeptidase